MDHGGFVIQGSRPPSVESSYRPRSGRSKNGYHTVAYQASVDETLFSSHHPSKVHVPLTEFKAPWECPKPKAMGKTFAESEKIKSKADKEKSTKPGERPLFWAPGADSTIHSYKSKDDKTSTSSMSNMSQFWNTRDHFRHFKHTPTFVDESLFGSKLKEPTFQAPWNKKLKGDSKQKAPNPKYYLWDNSVNQTRNGFHVDLQHDKYPSQSRPKTSLGIYNEKNTGISGGSKAVPVWKP